jgi:hypothetical protein
MEVRQKFEKHPHASIPSEWNLTRRATSLYKYSIGVVYVELDPHLLFHLNDKLYQHDRP